MRSRNAIFAAMLSMMPLGAQSADLVVRWEKGYNAEEDTAVAEIIAAFEGKTGKDVELEQPSTDDIEALALAAVAAGKPPDFLFGINTDYYLGQWAYDGQLVDLSDVIAPFANLFAPDALTYATLFDATTGRRGVYGLPLGASTHLIHVWRDLLEQAGFTLDDIPKEWDAFWSFWCDRVQPAVRKATGREDIYATGLAMSLSDDGQNGFDQFMYSYQGNYVTLDGKSLIDDPETRRRLIKAMDSYTAIYRKGCTPPGSVDWSNLDNNKRFYEQEFVMTANVTLSIPNGLRADRPDDYYEN